MEHAPADYRVLFFPRHRETANAPACIYRARGVEQFEKVAPPSIPPCQLRCAKLPAVGPGVDGKIAPLSKRYMEPQLSIHITR